MQRKIASLLLLAALWLYAGWATARVHTEEVAYQVDGETLVGYLAYDDAIPGKRPGVLVVHEWWGHDEYVRSRARQLAGQGYVALALDMYGKGKHATHPDDAKAFMEAVVSDMSGARRRFRAAEALLQGNPRVDGKKIAAIGYCFGGGIVLNMARMGEPLAAVASFHGSLGSRSPAPTERIAARIRVYTGGADPYAPPGQVAAFAKEMEAAGADYRITVYGGVKHSFTNPAADAYGEQFSMPLAYDAAADKASWQSLQDFLAETFAAN